MYSRTHVDWCLSVNLLFQKHSRCRVILGARPRSSPHQSQSNYLKLGRGSRRLGPHLAVAANKPLSAYDQSVAIAAPWSFPASQSSGEDEWTSGAPIQRGPACLHLLPWHRNSILDRFGVAGSQLLYLPTHYIEPSSPVFGARNMVSRQRELKGEKVDVKIVYLYWDPERRCA